MNVRKPIGKYFGILLSLLWALAFPMPSGAATITGISGTWAAKLSGSFRIGGYNAHQAKSDGNCTFSVVDSLYAGMVCRSFKEAQGQHYSGGVNVMVRASKLGWALDSAGLDQLKLSMTNWLVRKNRQQKRVLDPNNVSFQFQTLHYKPIRLSTNLGEPKIAQGILKGSVIQLVNGKYVARPFRYKLKIRFLGRAP